MPRPLSPAYAASTAHTGAASDCRPAGHTDVGVDTWLRIDVLQDTNCQRNSLPLSPVNAASTTYTGTASSCHPARNTAVNDSHSYKVTKASNLWTLLQLTYTNTVWSSILQDKQLSMVCSHTHTYTCMRTASVTRGCCFQSVKHRYSFKLPMEQSCKQPGQESGT